MGLWLIYMKNKLGIYILIQQCIIREKRNKTIHNLLQGTILKLYLMITILFLICKEIENLLRNS